MGKIRFQGKHIGDLFLSKEEFPDVEQSLTAFKAPAFRELSEAQRSDQVYQLLVQKIQKAEKGSFLLSAVVDYIDRINKENILEQCTFAHFELWLNQLSGLSFEENYRIRALIVGKWVPRDEYQAFFPIGMGKLFSGSHFVTAHQSPDLDTTIASFWGWVDAFGARVAEGLHIWNLPGGPNYAQVEIPFLFNHLFGEGIFSYLPKTRTTLSLTGLDLVTQKEVLKTSIQESMRSVDHERTERAVPLLDGEGYYLGDWRSVDVEGVQNVILLFNQCLRWFENYLHFELISLFAKETLSYQEVADFVASLIQMKMEACEPIKDFTENQKKQTHDYLTKVLGAPRGLESSFEEFAQELKKRSLEEFDLFFSQMRMLDRSGLFDKKGLLIENRPQIFHYLEKIIHMLSRAIYSVRLYVEKLEVALSIKAEVFGYLPKSISYRADVEEIKAAMGNYSYLTVTYADAQGKLLPLGVIHAHDMHKPFLGTVSLRDFCNREETKIPSYFEVISVIDHHKSALNTFSPPVAVIADAQSSNALLAEMAFAINDKYSLGGMSLPEIDAQIALFPSSTPSAQESRLLKRLLQRRIASLQNTTYFISPEREFIEYLHFLYAIFDDTDLLTKVSRRDVECVASLLNRLKSLMLKKEVEIITLDDLPQDGTFVRRLADRILQHPDTYSLYRKIYLAKEKGVEENFTLCLEGKSSSIFADTKEQNGCCRVGQTKVFARNIPAFASLAPQLRRKWYEDSVRVFKQKSEVDLHLHMLSTIAGAEDLFAGTEGNYTHQDELWIWIPNSEQAIEHLKSFLRVFNTMPQVVNNPMEVEFFGENAHELERIFIESFKPIARKTSSQSLPIAVLRYKAGSLNSRKAMISPCLPMLI